MIENAFGLGESDAPALLRNIVVAFATVFAFLEETPARLDRRCTGSERLVAHRGAMRYLESMRIAPKQAIHQSFLPPGDDQAYVWKYSEPIGGRRPRHFHAEPELNLVVRGSATFGIGQKVITVSSGELVAFPSAQDHVLLDSSPDLYLYAIGLDSSYSAQVLANESSHPFHVRLAGSELRPVLDSAADIVERSNVGQRGAELWQRVHWLARRAAPRSAHATHVLTRRTLQLLREGSDLPLTRLAQSLRAQPAEVSRHFHRDMGITLVRYRMRSRLLHFIRLVDSRKVELMVAASSAGFGSYSQCHRTFQTELNCSPREFFLSGLRTDMQRVYTDASLPFSDFEDGACRSPRVSEARWQFQGDGS